MLLPHNIRARSVVRLRLGCLLHLRELCDWIGHVLLYLPITLKLLMMRWVHDFWYYYSRTFVCMVIIDALLVGVIVFLLVEDKNQRETILKLRLEINDLKYRTPKQELPPRTKSFDCFDDYDFEEYDRDRPR